jgi:hypothetical protein
MHPFWNTKLGKLLIGGCGAQIGLLFTFGALTLIVMFCGICVLGNVAGLSLIAEPAAAVTAVPVEVSSAPVEIDLLREKIDLLVNKVIFVRANTAPPLPVPTPIPPPPPPKPIVLADQGGVNLRGGPGDQYNKVGRMTQGESLEIVGRNSDASWWLVVSPEGYFAWVSGMVVNAYNLNSTDLPVVSIPALLVQPAAGGSPVVGSVPGVIDPPAPVAGASAAALELPAGTPTAPASTSRRFVQDTLGYKQLIRRLLLPTVSESFSPDGAQIAITEKIKLYTITIDGSTSRILLEDDNKIDLLGGAVWSPDGKYLAVVANRLQNCTPPCRTVGLIRMGDGDVSWLDPPSSLALDRPRWTQDGRLLVTAYAGSLAQGTAYVYDASGQGQVAAGSFLLSSSHDGQKWFPWQPGNLWQVDPSRPVDSYYGD